MTPPIPEPRRVRIVEDDQAICELAADILAEAGFSVERECDPERAVALAGQKDFDVLVTDVLMPNLPGPELVSQIRSIRPRLPVLFVSGFNEEKAFRGTPLPERTAFLRKPFSPEALVRHVQTLLDGTGGL